MRAYKNNLPFQGKVCKMSPDMPWSLPETVLSLLLLTTLLASLMLYGDLSSTLAQASSTCSPSTVLSSA